MRVSVMEKGRVGYNWRNGVAVCRGDAPVLA